MIICEEDVSLQSWGWTDISSYWSELEAELQSSIMSRRSLRLDDGLLDRGLPLGSTSFSVGETSWRNTRSLKSRRSQQLSISCSESVLIHTPRKVSSLHSAASDASLLSSLLDDSSIQETTMVDTFWGLDQDVDPKESTIIAEQSSVLANSTLIGTDSCCPKHMVQTPNRVYCKDCESERKESATTYHSAAKYSSLPSSLSSMGSKSSPPADPETSTIICRSRKGKTAGVLVSMWASGLSTSRRSSAWVVGLLTLLFQHLLPSDTQNMTGHEVMSLTEVNADQKELHSIESLCDDCMDKQRSKMKKGSSPSSARAAALSFVWELAHKTAVITASQLSQLTQTTVSVVWPLTLKAISASQSAGRSAGKTATEGFTWLRRRWNCMVADTPRSQQIYGIPLKIIVAVSLLLLLLNLCWFGPATLQSVLPGVDTIERKTEIHDVPASSSESQGAEIPLEDMNEEQQLDTQPTEMPTDEQEVEALAVDSARLLRLEQNLDTLWERVEAGGQRAEQRHKEMMQLYADLQQKLLVTSQSRSEVSHPWLSGLLDQQLSQLRKQMDEDRQLKEQMRQQDLVQQQTQMSRLDQLELQLQTLSEGIELMQEAVESESSSSVTLPPYVSVDHESHDALQSEVARLEAALQDMRQEVAGLSLGQDSCQQLDGVEQMVSSQVLEQIRSQVYGNRLDVNGGASEASPESLLQWLSQQYVTNSDLQGSLTSMEVSLLQNISLQLEQQPNKKSTRKRPPHSARVPSRGGTMTQEDVHTIVTNALRLFSQDRTGLADYALESGGGSILSTRCSETYETKAALLSLFGFPLWYFSQSPRVVIQPDVHPGNCWAFKGSTGFLVIRLSMSILPTAFSLEHIPKALAPSGTLSSAPRDFSVYGLDDESQEQGTLLGSYTYQEDGEALQTYSVSEEVDQAFQIIEVKVLSNWGHEEYTCMYRFRVHGTPSDA